MNTKILFLSLISGLSTVLGCLILLISKKYKDKVLSFSFGVASSVMFIISVLELIPEALSYMINDLSIPVLFIISLLLLMSGGVIVRLLDKYSKSDNELYNVGWLCSLSILVHNIPEGIITAISLLTNFDFGMKMFFMILIHNIPEGISIAAPIYYSGNGVKKSLFYSTVSGGGELFGAILGLFVFRTFNMNLSKESLSELFRINENKILKFGNINVSFFNTTHSIPESVAISINTEDGSIVYCTDFNFSPIYNGNYQTSFDKITELGKKKVLAFFYILCYYI